MTVSPPSDPDDAVGQVIERAAEKVAAATAVSGRPALSSFQVAIIVGSVLLVAALVALGLSIVSGIRQDLHDTDERVKAACKLAALSSGAQEAPAGALRLAECLAND